MSALYTNIPQSEGLEAAREALEERTDKTVPTDYIMKLLQIILSYNIFEFDKEFYIQLLGVAMGCVPAVSFANIFMAKKIDPLIMNEAMKFAKDNNNPVIMLKRFIDDIFMIWRGSVEDLHKFITKINQIHPNIKFTFSHNSPNNATHTCTCPPVKSIPFLDTSCSISNNNIKTDLFKKETDRNQYLLTSSCHPAHITQNIPYSLALRIVRICSDPEDRDNRFAELRSMLLQRDYKAKVIDLAIQRAKSVPREEALKKVVKTKTNNRPVLVLQYDPRLPSLSKIINKHYRSMVTQDQYLKEVFPLPPLVAYKRPRNVRDLVVKARVPPPYTRSSARIQAGYKKCTNISCMTCPYAIPGKNVKSFATKLNVEVNAPVNCFSNHIVYCISCIHCGQQYIGESHRSLKERFGEHRGYVRGEKLNKATGEHFNLEGHSISDMRIQIVEKIFTKNGFFRKEREKMFINKFDTKRKGLNKVK